MTTRLWLYVCCIVVTAAVLPLRIEAQQVTPQRLAASASEPQNWLTYSGNYFSTRFTPLDQITPANVKNLKLQWVYQSPVAGNWQTTPLVVDGIMYITQRLNDVVALDATPAARSGSSATRRRPTASSVAARTTAAWPSLATRCTWRRSTRS